IYSPKNIPFNAQHAIKVTLILISGFHKSRHGKKIPMKPTKLPILFLALLISVSACGGSRSIHGKWEADVVSKRSGPGVKIIYEFLPDGTFNAMPPGDTTLVDQDK